MWVIWSVFMIEDRQLIDIIVKAGVAAVSIPIFLSRVILLNSYDKHETLQQLYNAGAG
jgi:hypothetical protein